MAQRRAVLLKVRVTYAHAGQREVAVEDADLVLNQARKFFGIFPEVCALGPIRLYIEILLLDGQRRELAL